MISYVMDSVGGITIFWNWGLREHAPAFLFYKPWWVWAELKWVWVWLSCVEGDFLALRGAGAQWQWPRCWAVVFPKNKGYSLPSPCSNLFALRIKTGTWEPHKPSSPIFSLCPAHPHFEILFIHRGLGKFPSSRKPIKMTPPSHCIFFILE